MSDEGRPVRMAFSVTSARVQHYDDIVEYMVKDAIEKYKQQHKQNPSQEQIAFLRKEMVRYAVIRHDMNTATKLSIKSNILLEH